MKKILFLIHDLDFGGAEKVLVNLANNLDKTKYDVTIKTLFDVGTNRNHINDDVNYIGGFRWRFRGNATLLRKMPAKLLSKIFINDRYDIVIAFLEGPDTRIVSVYGGKKIAWIHTDFETKEVATHHFNSEKEFVDSYKRFDKVICVAETVKKRFLTYVDLENSCEVLYNVNETDLIIQKSKENQDDIVSKSETFNIVSVGRLIDVKGFDRLIAIQKKLIDNNVKCDLFILGDGPNKAELLKLIEKNGLEDNCHLLGFQENPYKFTSKADLFVCSSNKEGFSTAVTEALVLGVPVVSTDVSGARELLGNNNEYGIVTEINEDALYEGVHKMLTEDGLLAYYKKQAEIRGKDFSTEKTTKAVEKMLDEVLGD